MKAICSVLRLVIVAAALLVSDGQALPHNHVHFAPVATLTTANETMAGVGKIPCTVAFKGWMGEEDGTHKDESTGQSVHDKYYHLSGKSTIGCWKSDGSQLKKHVCVVDAVRTPVLTTNTGDGECLRDPDCASGPYEVPIVKSKDDEARLKTESRMDEAKWCMSPNAMVGQDGPLYGINIGDKTSTPRIDAFYLFPGHQDWKEVEGCDAFEKQFFTHKPCPLSGAHCYVHYSVGNTCMIFGCDKEGTDGVPTAGETGTEYMWGKIPNRRNFCTASTASTECKLRSECNQMPDGVKKDPNNPPPAAQKQGGYEWEGRGPKIHTQRRPRRGGRSESTTTAYDPLGIDEWLPGGAFHNW